MYVHETTQRFLKDKKNYSFKFSESRKKKYHVCLLIIEQIEKNYFMPIKANLCSKFKIHHIQLILETLCISRNSLRLF